jgi:hypothetical protein
MAGYYPKVTMTAVANPNSQHGTDVQFTLSPTDFANFAALSPPYFKIAGYSTSRGESGFNQRYRVVSTSGSTVTAEALDRRIEPHAAASEGGHFTFYAPAGMTMAGVDLNADAPPSGYPALGNYELTNGNQIWGLLWGTPAASMLGCTGNVGLPPM